QKDSLPGNFGRHHPVTWAFEDTAYVLTGATNANPGGTKDFFMYTASDDSWEVLSDFPGPARSYAYGHAHQGKGYIGFGSFNSAFNDLWEYDPQSGIWTELSSCPCAARNHPAFIAHKGKIYVGLGNNSGGNLKDWWVYDITTDSWGQLPSLPGPARHHPYHFAVGDSVYAGFGHGNGIFKDWYRYFPGDSSWRETTVTDTFPGQGRVAGTEFGHLDKGYVLSGDGDMHSRMDKGEFWEFDPETGEWTELTPHPRSGRWAPGSFVLGNMLYFLAGQDKQGNLRKDMWAYELPEPPEDSIPTGISELNHVAFKVYPNPAQNRIRLSSELPVNENFNIHIYNAQGQMLSNSTPKDNSVNISQLSSGVYFIIAENERGERRFSRFVKQ
ncbi:MAG: kelch repeat-containing protein, partial [Chitinophagales bacterium]